MKKKNAFNLTDTLLTMSILGVVIAIMTITLKDVTPDKEQVKFLKAYHSLQAAVETVISDETKYDQRPGATQSAFLNQMPLSTGETTMTNGTLTANDAFCYFVADQMNILGGASCTSGAATNIMTTSGACFSNMVPFSDNSVNVIVDIKCSGSADDKYVINVTKEGKIDIPETTSGNLTPAKNQCKARYWAEHQSATKREVGSVCG